MLSVEVVGICKSALPSAIIEFLRVLLQCQEGHSPQLLCSSNQLNVWLTMSAEASMSACQSGLKRRMA